MSKDDYTKEELLVLASLRRGSGRTCVSCAWYVPKGKQRGCFPNGKYRKWLAAEECQAGCEAFEGKGKSERSQ